MAEKPQPVRVLYCEVCGLPAEYCEFGPDFEKCKPWLIRNAPHVYPDLVKEAGCQDAADNLSDQLHSTSISDVGSSSKPKEEVKRLPGGKVKKKESVMSLLEAPGGATLSTDEADRIYMQVVGGVKKQRIQGTCSYGSSVASDGRTYARHSSSYKTILTSTELSRENEELRRKVVTLTAELEDERAARAAQIENERVSLEEMKRWRKEMQKCIENERVAREEMKRHMKARMKEFMDKFGGSSS